MGEQGELRTLREWTPMTHLLQQIPLKAQKGLFTHELNLTCVDCLPDFLVLGTNLGLVYWYDRRKDKLQRLRCENSTSPIVCVKVVSTVDYMIAAGSEDGNVTVFQIPRPVPDVAPPSLNSKQNRQIERFTIGGLHASPVTALEWSPNGMNLFSGDKLGIIVLTEIDFYMHLSKSREIINEKYEVVQLSYHSSTGVPHGKLLLVSTTYRTTMCSWRQEDRTWKVSQLGQRERKTLGPFGASFFHPLGIDIASHRDIIFASRPGLRLWQAGLDGIVQQTLIFKDALMCPHPSIMLVNPVPSRFKMAKVVNGKNKGRRAATKTEEGGVESLYQHQLGYLHPFAGGYLVAHWKGPSGSILVLDPEDTGVIASVKTGPGGLRSIISVAVSPASSKPVQNNLLDNNAVEQGPEIFVLEGSRSLIRIAYSPDYNHSKGSEELDESFSSSFKSLFTASIFPSSLPSPPPLLRDLTSSILDFTSGSGTRSSKPGEHSGASSDLDTGNIASSSDGEATMPKEKKMGNENIIMADEALEIPPIVGLPFETIPDVKLISPPSPETPARKSSIDKKVVEDSKVNSSLQQRVNDEVLYKPKKKKEKRKKSNTKAPPQALLDPGISEDSSSPSMSRSDEDASHLVQTDGAVAKETNKSMHSSWPPPGSEGERGSLQAEKGPKALHLDGKEKKKDKVERRRKSEVVTNVSLRSSIVEEGHVGGMAWLPTMPLAPDLRSPTSIRQDVESKGELLAKLLDLKPILPQPLPKHQMETNSAASENSAPMLSERSFALKVADGPDANDSCEAPSLVLETSVKIGEPEVVTRPSLERETVNQRMKTEEEMMDTEVAPRDRAYSLDSEWEVISD